MSGRNKRLGQAFLRALALELAERRIREERLRSAREWARTGIDGVVAELKARLGGTAGGVRVFGDWAAESYFKLLIRYRGNGVELAVEINEARQRRAGMMDWLERKGDEVMRMPCRHEREPVARRVPEPPIFLQSPASVALIGEISPVIASRIRMHCPDCNAVLG